MKLNLFFIFVGLVALSIAPNKTFADYKPLPIKNPQVLVANSPKKITFWQSGVNRMNVSAQDNQMRNAALSSFILTFDNSDHKINAFAVEPVQKSIDANFVDENGGDPFSFGATYWAIPGSQKEVATFNFPHDGTSRLSPIPSGFVPALNGFSFWTSVRTDCSILGVQIGFNEAADKAIGKVDSECGNKFSGNFYYVLVPQSAIKEKRVVSGTGRNMPNAGEFPENERYIIRSFTLKYNNGTHFLKSMGVHLADVKKGRDAISWQDNNQDDPIYWSIEYYILN